MTRRLTALLGATLALLVAACADDGSGPASTPPPAAPVVELVGGHWARLDGRLIAEFHPRAPMRLRVARPATLTARWVADGSIPVALGAPRPAADGFLIDVEMPATAVHGVGRLEVSAPGAPAVSLPARWVADPKADPLRQAVRRQWRTEKDRAGALARLAAFEPGDRSEQIWKAGERARVLYADGQLDAAVEGMRQAAEIAGAARPSDAAAHLTYAAFYAYSAGDRAQARALSERALSEARAVDDDLRAVYALTYIARLERDRGRLRAAEHLMEEARLIAARVGDTASVRILDDDRATMLGRQGRHREALAITDIGSHRAARINQAWRRLQAMQAGAIGADYAAIAETWRGILAERQPAWIDADRANVELNLAFTAWLAGEPAVAGAAVGRAWALDPERAGYHPQWARLIQARAALDQRRFDAARAAFIDAARLAERESAGPSVAGWHALHGEGQALRAMGQPAAALARWQAAWQMSRQLARRTALSTSRDSFLSGRRPLVTDLTAALLADGRVAEAFAVVDEASAPTLRAIAAASEIDALGAEALATWDALVQAWQVASARARQLRRALETTPADQRPAAEAAAREAARLARAELDAAWAWLDTRAPEPIDPVRAVPAGSVALSLIELADGWHGFLVADGRVEHRRVDAEAPLGPWASRLGTRPLYVAPGGLSAARALAEPGALMGPASLVPFVGWLAHSPAAPRGRALVVADPDGTLPVSRAAARRVAEGVDARVLVGPEATREAVLAGLDGAPWMHFDGHGVVVADPWDSHLRLADDQRLSLADLLTARPRVGVVILGACDAGRRAAVGAGAAISLADGFLLAGASTVLAADRPLGVDEAARMVEALHRHGVTRRPAEALRATAAELRAQGDDGARGWRVFGRTDPSAR